MFSVLALTASWSRPIIKLLTAGFPKVDVRAFGHVVVHVVNERMVKTLEYCYNSWILADLPIAQGQYPSTRSQV